MKQLLVLLGIVTAFAFSSCTKKASDAIVGNWILSHVENYNYDSQLEDFQQEMIWEFGADGMLRFETSEGVVEGLYSVDGSNITLRYGKNGTQYNFDGTIIGMDENSMIWSRNSGYMYFYRTDESIAETPSQTVRLEWDGRVFYDGETVTCTNDENGSGDLVQHIQIRNRTDETKCFVIEKEVIQGLDGVTNSISANRICVSAQSVNDEDLSFHAIYEDQVYGMVIVEYYVYEENNPDERISLTVRYNRFSGETPEGALKGLFTVNANGDQVLFSQGNLQYQATTDTWRFAEQQWDYVGVDNTLAGSNYSGWIDLFGWGTSGYNHGAVCYQPWSISMDNYDYWAYGNSSYYLHDQTGKADWGYNPISNGGNLEGLWHTMTISEWDYVLNNRPSSTRFVKAIVNNVNGYVLLPDNWNVSIFELNDVNNEWATFDSNSISSTEWNNLLEANGAVFLPQAGLRYGDSFMQDRLDYWSSTAADDYCALGVAEGFSLDMEHNRFDGKSVRLVCSVQTSFYNSVSGRYIHHSGSGTPIFKNE